MTKDPTMIEALQQARQHKQFNVMMMDAMDFDGVPEVQTTPLKPVDLTPKGRK